MKKTFKFFAAALAIVAAASCAKETANDQNAENDQPKVHMTFSASIDPETKTALNDKLVEWIKGDKITLYGVNSYSDKTNGYHIHKGYMTIDAESLSDNKDLVSFSGDIVSSPNYCAFYPGDSWNVNKDIDYVYEHKGFESQNAVKGTFDPSMHVMAASTLENGIRFNFKNICALAKITIGESGVYSVKIEGVESTGYASIGGTYRWKSGGGDFRFATHSSSTYKSNTITLKNQNDTALEKGATYYIVLPVCEIKGFTVSICNQSGAVLKSISKSSNFNVERNKIYDLGTFEVPDPAKVGDYFYSDGSYSTELDKSRTVVGVVFYAGNPTEDDTTLKKDFPNCVNGLVVGLSQSSGSEFFGENNVSWESTDFMSTVGVEYKSGSIIPREPGASLKTGYNNTAAFRAKDSGAFALNYCNNMPSVSIASTWFIPTVAEFDAMYESLAVINNSIEAVNGTKLSGFYSTTSQEYMYPTFIGNYNINEKRLVDQKKSQSGVVRPIFAF